MCYAVFLSTTSSEDLSTLPTDQFRFEAPDSKEDDNALRLLRYPHKWYLACRYGGCSCHYRHLSSDPASSEPWFDPPEDWLPEDGDDVESTMALYDELTRIVNEGHRVDVLDSWNCEGLESVHDLSVSVAEVPRECFRFFQNVRFDLAP